jgi:hypothetical protein
MSVDDTLYADSEHLLMMALHDKENIDAVRLLLNRGQLGVDIVRKGLQMRLLSEAEDLLG